jgi:hypothetical protein
MLLFVPLCQIAMLPNSAARADAHRAGERSTRQPLAFSFFYFIFFFKAARLTAPSSYK